jgi:glutamate racemase
VTDKSVAGNSGSIGVFDSGVGGLTVLREIRSLLPHENIIYFADQANVPYGPRPNGEVQHLTKEISQFLIDQGAKIIVVACNTASAAALDYLRTAITEVPFVGMEPAIKPGSVESFSGHVGVLATVGTFDSERYASLMTRFAKRITVYEDPCIGLVEQVEAGALDTAETERILQDALDPMLQAGVDTLVLGCTHYPFVMPLIKRLAGPEVVVIDPAPAVARQLQYVLGERDLMRIAEQPGTLSAYTTGDDDLFSVSAARLLDATLPSIPVFWRAGKISPGDENFSNFS